jgi:hypothetical protein
MIISERLDDLSTSQNGEVVIKIKRRLLNIIGIQTTSELCVYLTEDIGRPRIQISLSPLQLSSNLAYLRLLIKGYQGSLSDVTEKIRQLGISIEKTDGFVVLGEQGIAEMVLKLPTKGSPKYKPILAKLQDLSNEMDSLGSQCVISSSRPEPIVEIIPETAFKHFEGAFEVTLEEDFGLLTLDQKLSQKLGLSASDQYVLIGSAYGKIPIITIQFFSVNELTCIECFLKDYPGSLDELLHGIRNHFDLSFIDLSGVRGRKYFAKILGKVTTSAANLENAVRCCNGVVENSFKLISVK